MQSQANHLLYGPDGRQCSFRQALASRLGVLQELHGKGQDVAGNINWRDIAGELRVMNNRAQIPSKGKSKGSTGSWMQSGDESGRG